MTQAYHWPHPDAVEALNVLLKLPATGREQDWEVEMADESRLSEMLALFTNGHLDLECRSALMLLILSALDFHDEFTDDLTATAAAVRNLLLQDHEVHLRMQSYWSRHEVEGLVAAVLQ